MNKPVRLWGSLGMLIAFAVALTVFGGSGTPTASTTPTTFADLDIPDPPLPTSTITALSATPTGKATLSPEPVLSRVLPETLRAGRLVVVTGQGSRRRLVVILDAFGTRRTFELPADASGFDVDASGRTLAFLTGQGDNRRLRIVPFDDEPFEVRTLGEGNVREFAWSGDEPGHIAWLAPDAGDALGMPLLSVKDVDDPSPDPAVLSFPPTSARLFGLNSSGSWVGFEGVPGSSWIGYTPANNRTGFTLPADLAIVPPSGSLTLLADLDMGLSQWMFGLADDGITPLAWAPGDAGAGLADISDDGDIAFIGINSAAESWVEVWAADGSGGDRITIPYRIWEVRWAPGGLDLVMPGTDEQGQHVVVVHNTLQQGLHAIIFEDRVQFAAFIP